MIKIKHLSNPTLFSICILSLLIFRFGPYIQGNSYDLVQHFLLVDEIMKHGGVRPPPIPNLTTMALYPPASHWMAAAIGWIGGSGLVGISLITIVSVYLIYLMVVRLVAADAPTATLLFLAVFLALRFTRSQVGWEVVGNFFYPQLVADVAYFAILLWASNHREIPKQVLAMSLTGIVTMWIQPLVAIHILASGCVLLAFQYAESWKNNSSALTRNGFYLVVFIAVSISAVLLHPAFRIMREISANDGDLEFRYGNVIVVSVLCAAVGLFNLWRRWTARAGFVDLILGSAVVAAAGLSMLQFLLLVVHGDGSSYAVKKHMFIVFTLGIMNAVRALARLFPRARKQPAFTGMMAPLVAGVMSFFVLRGFNTPVAPIIDAMNYANHAASFDLPDFVPGNTVADDPSLPRLANVMISLSAFQHPFNATAITWLRGASMRTGTEFVMVPHDADLAAACGARFAESATYVIVEQACLKH